MTQLVLYHNAMSTCAQKVRFVLAEKGLDYEERHLNLRAGEQHTLDYLKLNPMGVVPTLIFDGTPIQESTIICEFLDDLAPSPALKPKAPQDRAQMRLWMKKLDDYIHAETGVMSNAIAFRYQKLDKGVDHAQKLVEGIPNEAKKERMRSIVFEGVESPLFLRAMTVFDRLLSDMETALGTQPWLAGAQLSLADVVYSPYITRLDHLQLAGLWSARPGIRDWYARLKALHGYQEGLVKWFDPNYVTLMKEKGEEAWPKIAAHLEAA